MQSGVNVSLHNVPASDVDTRIEHFRGLMGSDVPLPVVTVTGAGFVEIAIVPCIHVRLIAYTDMQEGIWDEVRLTYVPGKR